MSAEQSDKRALFLKTFLVNNGILAKFYLQLSIQNDVHVMNLEKDINNQYIKQRIEYLNNKNFDESSDEDEGLQINQIDVITYMKLIFNFFAKNTF